MEKCDYFNIVTNHPVVDAIVVLEYFAICFDAELRD